MVLFLGIMIILLIILCALLYLRIMQDRRVNIARSEMPGKVVVLTGANTQFGEALARAFYATGCKMVLVGPERQELERVRSALFSLRPKDIPVYQPECVPMESNELEFAANEKAAEIIELCGPIDILINNSTICPRSDILSTNVDGDIRVMNVNYFGPLAFTKAFLPHMVQRKSGLIVVISSVAGKVPIPLRSSFAASKHALQAFADCLRAEMAVHDVKVLVSSPEYIPSDAVLTENDEIAGPEDKKVIPERIVDITKAKKQQMPQKIAEEILMAVLRDDKEHMSFSFKFAYWLRVTLPPFFHLMLSERFRRMLEFDNSSNIQRY